jgi:hypothetical protein
MQFGNFMIADESGDIQSATGLAQQALLCTITMSKWQSVIWRNVNIFEIDKK